MEDGENDLLWPPIEARSSWLCLEKGFGEKKRAEDGEEGGGAGEEEVEAREKREDERRGGVEKERDGEDIVACKIRRGNVFQIADSGCYALSPPPFGAYNT